MTDNTEPKIETLPLENTPSPCIKKSIMRQCTGWLPAFFAFFAFCLSGITLYGVLCLKKQMDAQQNQVMAIIKQTGHEQQTFNTQLQNLKKTISSGLSKTQVSTLDWHVLKARDYLELAQLNSSLYDNPTTTISLMEKANALLESVPTVKIQDIRKHLQTTITTLKAATPRDTQHLFSQLSLLQSMTKKLKFNTTPTLQNTASQPNGTETTWRTRLKQTLTTVENYIVIRHNTTNTTQILSPLHQTVLEDSLSLNFQIAQWAVLQKNAALYQEALHNAENEIQKYALQSHETTRAMLTSIHTLRGFSIVPITWDGKELLELNAFVKELQPS